MSAPIAKLGVTLSGQGVAAIATVVDLPHTGIGGAGRIQLTGAQTYDIDLAMMPTAGLKGLVVQVDATDGAGDTVTTPVTLQWTSNATVKSEELSPGGFLALCSPSPVNGITALSIITTANAVVHVTAIG